MQHNYFEDLPKNPRLQEMLRALLYPAVYVLTGRSVATMFFARICKQMFSADAVEKNEHCALNFTSYSLDFDIFFS
jgi:hypothetical protein